VIPDPVEYNSSRGEHIYGKGMDRKKENKEAEEEKA